MRSDPPIRFIARVLVAADVNLGLRRSSRDGLEFLEQRLAVGHGWVFQNTSPSL